MTDSKLSALRRSMTAEQWAEHWRKVQAEAQHDTHVDIGGREYERLPARECRQDAPGWPRMRRSPAREGQGRRGGDAISTLQRSGNRSVPQP
jgi:hypothetical protein